MCWCANVGYVLVVKTADIVGGGGLAITTSDRVYDAKPYNTVSLHRIVKWSPAQLTGQSQSLFLCCLLLFGLDRSDRFNACLKKQLQLASHN